METRSELLDAVVGRQLAPRDGQAASLGAHHRCRGVEGALLLVVKYHVQLDKDLAAADAVLAADPEPGKHVLVDPGGRLQSSLQSSLSVIVEK